ALQAVVVIQFGTSARPSPRVLPSAPVHVLGATVGRDRLLLAVIALAAAVLGWWPVRSEAANWAIASLLAGLAGVLAAPITSVTPSTMTLAVVPALAAALVADLSSFTIAAAAGLLIGVGQSLCVKAATSWTWFPQHGVPEVLPFAVIAVVMLARGNRLPTRGEATEGRLPRAPLGSRPLLPLALFAPATALLLVVTRSGWRAAVIQSVVTACVLLSLTVLTGFVGQVSLAQAAFAGTGGFLMAKLLAHAGVPFPVGLIVAGAVAVPVGL